MQPRSASCRELRGVRRLRSLLARCFGFYNRTHHVPAIASAGRFVDVEPLPAYDFSDAPHLLTTVLPLD